MRRFLLALVLLAALVSPVHAAAPVVSILGDSISAIGRFPIKYAIQYLGASAYHDYAVSGATTTDLVNNQLPSALADNSTIVIIFAGTNDFGMTPPYSLATTESNLSSMARQLAAAGKQVIFVAPLPRCYGDVTIDVPTRAALRGIALYMTSSNERTVDAWVYFDDGTGCLRSDLGEDSQHPNEPGEMLLGGLMGGQIAGQVPTPLPVGTATPVPTPTITPTPGAVFTFSAAPSGGNAVVSWANEAGGHAQDWIGIYAPSGADSAYLAWSWVNCTNTSTASAGTTAVPTGSCSYPRPSGTYSVRLFSNNTFGRIATASVTLP